MSLTVLSVGYPLTEVGLHASGGSEQVLATIDDALVSAGHRSLVLAARGSQVRGTLIEAASPPAVIDDAARATAIDEFRHLLRNVLDRFAVDLIHMHGLDFYQYLPDTCIPTLATLHLPVDWYPAHIFDDRRHKFWLNAVSNTQHATLPASHRLLPPVCNGVALRPPTTTPVVKSSFALCLGRVCPEKGFHWALQAAHLAEAPLLVAGQMFPLPGHAAYFDEQIRPWLDRERQFIGAVHGRRKAELLAQAQCLIVSSTVAETSSLVAMEALTAGTPVVAWRVGALPELIQYGNNGYLVSSLEEMAEAIRNCAQLSSESCRNSAQPRFSAQRMTSQYLAIYEKVAMQARCEITAL